MATVMSTEESSIH